MKDNTYKRILLGILGEKIIAKYFRDKGIEVNESLNIFDNIKDMIINNNNVEVKTQVPYLNKDCFSIDEKQFKKIINSYRVYWVSVPTNKIQDEFAGCVYEMNPKEVEFYSYDNHNKKMIAFPRKQKAMKIIFKIKSKKLLNHLIELSSSFYNYDRK